MAVHTCHSIRHFISYQNGLCCDVGSVGIETSIQLLSYTFFSFRLCVVIFPAKATNNPHGLGVRLTIGVSWNCAHSIYLQVYRLSHTYLLYHSLPPSPVVCCLGAAVPEKHIVQPWRYGSAQRWCVHQVADGLKHGLEVVLFRLATYQKVRVRPDVVYLVNLEMVVDDGRCVRIGIDWGGTK